MSAITVAAVQAGSPLFDTAAAMVKGEVLIREAAAAGARLIVLPEAYLGGYP
jgi:nitrilase